MEHLDVVCGGGADGLARGVWAIEGRRTILHELAHALLHASFGTREANALEDHGGAAVEELRDDLLGEDLGGVGVLGGFGDELAASSFLGARVRVVMVGRGDDGQLGRARCHGAAREG